MTHAKRPWFQRPSRVIPAGLLVLGVVAGLVWFLSPWPASLLIRGMFERGAAETVAEMQPFVPASGVDAQLGLQYGTGGADTTFDLFRPTGATEALPTLVWIHGGAWISGDAANVDPYVKIIVAHGYTGVSLNYTVAPEATYPTALTQLNDALAHLIAHADEYGIDTSRIVIAGDSAGANLTSQLALLVTNPAYASQLGMRPALTPEQLRGVVLNCGIYDVSGIPNAPGIGGWGFRISLWAYLGDKDWSNTPGGDEMSTLDFVTSDFPATWISGGNGDPLTPGQSQKLEAKLTSLGVTTTPVFYPTDHEPSLPHEYQFHLHFADAQAALESTITFLGSVTG